MFNLSESIVIFISFLLLNLFQDCTIFLFFIYYRLLNHREPVALEKIKCLLNYFRIVTETGEVYDLMLFEYF